MFILNIRKVVKRARERAGKRMKVYVCVFLHVRQKEERDRDKIVVK